MIEIVEHSNLLEVKSGIICHQVNCIGAMGAGLALNIRNKWPIVFNQYKEDCKCFMTHPDKMLGHVLDVSAEPSLVVANCFGQVFPLPVSGDRQIMQHGTPYWRNFRT